MYQRILFPTDGGPATGDIAAHVTSLATYYDATVHVLSVADTRNRFEGPNMGLGAEAWDDAQHEQAQQAVADAVDALADSVPVSRHIESGIPHSAILDYAHTADVDVIVMGTHGRTGIDHYLIGSIAERIVRNAPMPVLTVGPTNGTTDAS
jgi:nucleotide-binding universal stress UspA family protein